MSDKYKPREYWGIFALGHIFTNQWYLNRRAAETYAQPGDRIALFREVIEPGDALWEESTK